MYEAYYGLAEKPFSILPDPDLIYWASNHRLAFAMLEFGIRNNAGFTVITGDVGSGKTTLVRHLLRKLPKNTTVGLISNAPRSREELLQLIMMSARQPFDEPYVSLYRRFQSFLHEQYAHRRRTILILDEAQNLGAGQLEELRMLSNLNAGKHQLLQLILVGQPQLKELLQTRELLQFAQRVSSDFHLEPLPLAEVAGYIDYRLAAVGAAYQLFTDDACAMIGRASRGVPRTINILCDTALVYGYAANAEVIDDALVAAVIENKREYGILPIARSRV
jgi:general secretion pathway protein A